MNIYFSGSIRGGRDDVAFYYDLIKELKKHGHVLTEHIGDSLLNGAGEPGMTDREIHDRDVEWLKSADCVVAEVTSPSHGVGYEIGRAVEWGKPTLCLFRQVKGRRLSAMIAGNDALTAREYTSRDDLATLLNQFFARFED